MSAPVPAILVVVVVAGDHARPARNACSGGQGGGIRLQKEEIEGNAKPRDNDGLCGD
jgi:hypothetical protein